MGQYIIVSALPDQRSRALAQDLRRAAEAAGWSLDDLSSQTFIATMGPQPPQKTTVGGWLLFGDVLNRRDVVFPAPKASDPYEYERKLVARFWGRYIGLSLGTDGQARFILRDPSGGLECVAWEQDGLSVVASTAAQWLVGRLSPPWSLDLARIGQAMRDPLISADWLLLAGPTVIPPGTVQPLPLARPAEAVWSPLDFARRSLNEPRRPDEAAASIRNAVDEAVAGLAGLPGPLAAEVSGGFDSSSVATSLIQAKAPVALWLNAHGSTPEADERTYVRALAETLGITPDLVPHATGRLTEELLERISGGFRPGLNALDMHHDLDWARRVDQAGAKALMTGKGGDSILLQNASSDVFADLWLRKGWRALFDSDAPRLAACNEVSVWSMATLARKAARPRPLQLRREDAVLDDGVSSPPPSHAWLPEDHRFGPAKIQQIAGVIDSVSRHGPSLLTERIDVRHPLCAQPVIETCLAIPTPLLTIGGRDRGLARRAFRERLPALIAERRSKGDMTSIYGRMILGSLDMLRPWLLDGRLAAFGIIDRTRTEAMLTEDNLMWRGQYGAVIRAAAFEGWARVWSRRLQTPAR